MDGSLNGRALSRSRPAVRLTLREVEVLMLVSDGCTSQEIADRLFLSRRTIDFHLRNIYAKLQVGNRIAALRRGVQLGLLPFEPSSTGSLQMPYKADQVKDRAAVAL